MQGHLDSPLTPKGVRQARRAGLFLGELIGDPRAARMIASPLGRARRTAAMVADALGIDYAACRHDDRLKEITWGDWDGLTRAEIEARYPGALTRRLKDHWNAVPPCGESYAVVAARAQQWMGGVTGTRPLVVVGHGAWGRVLRGIYLGLSAADTLALDEPQDAVFRLAGETIDRFDVDHG